MSLFQRICLKPSYSLRRQLLLSFVSSAFLVISTVVALAVLFAQEAGRTVQDQATLVLKDQVVSSFVSSSSHVAERFTAHMLSLEGALQLVVESVRDRIVGYPNPGWDDDSFVPFFDTETKRNKYPLQMPPAPLDWNISSNFGPEDYDEHVQERGNFIFKEEPSGTAVTTASGVYHMQGSCNPDLQNPGELGYYENCTAEHNNLETGGIVQPTNTSKWLHRVTGDLTALVKPIYEVQQEVLVLGVYFVNSGAGSSFLYPGHTLPETLYESEGCGWMNQTNPHTNKPIATFEEISRCHPKGERVDSREYNPLERPWFPKCIEEDEGATWHGPFDIIGGSIRIVLICRGIFDRQTGHLIGAATMQVTTRDLRRGLEEARLHGDASAIAIVRYEDGTVFADTVGLANTGLPKVYETDFISKKNYLELRELADFTKPWETPEELQDTLMKSYIICKGSGAYIYTAFPMPMPPLEYDPQYRPKFLILHSVSNIVFKAVDEMDDRISEDFREIVAVSIGLGILGMLATTFIVCSVSQRLTRPLIWIENVSWSILNHKDERAIESLRITADVESVAAIKFPSRTEITQLVAEFRSMINGFSGDNASKVAQSNRAELLNTMTWQSDFQQLYSFHPPKKRMSFLLGTAGTSGTSKTEEDTLSVPWPHGEGEGMLPRVDEARLPEAFTGSSIVPAPPKKNVGANISGRSNNLSKKNDLENEFSSHRIRAFRSSLFWWILVLIAIPLVLTNILICVTVSYKLVSTVPGWVDIVQESSLDLERSSLNATAAMKAELAGDVIREVVRDLHFITRMAGWLLFEGIQRSNALIEMDEATEDCKNYPVDKSCPFFNSGRTPCPCEWKDLPKGDCSSAYLGTDTRTLQRRHWYVQARDADPRTGTRLSASSFPKYDFRANETLWWDTTDDLPGVEKGKNATGFETSYDRIRTTSAMAIVDFPVYNYMTALKRQKHTLGSYLGFEADGTLTGFNGCDYDFPYVSHWQSTTDNKAEEIAPRLCPLGKFGYDSRCRGWYSTGKSMQLAEGKYLHLTAPYVFAGTGEIAASATSPLINPITGEYVGQALLDFGPAAIRDALRRLTRQPVSFVITPDYDSTGGDTLLGPDRSFEGWKSANILHLLFQNETASSGNMGFFEKHILPNLKAGKSDVTTYKRWPEAGTEETLVLAYHPVRVRAYQALNPEDFGRGVSVTETLVYTVGVAVSDEAMSNPFNESRDDITDDLERLRSIYICLVVFVSALFTVYTCLITVSITKPIITLLRVVQRINADDIEDELPPLQGESREVHQIYNSFSKLIKIVRMSNIAFFTGNLKWAHDFISDALKLFRAIDDQKAIGIACNNLGNTLYAMMYEARSSGETDLDHIAIDYDTAMSRYNEAVEIGQRQFKDATGENEKSEFAQQLADRLFNRALFGLLAEKSGMAPSDAKESALRDLERVHELDDDIKDFWLERKLLLLNSGTCYDRLLRRIHGLIDFYDDDAVHQLWDVKELIDEADHLLLAAWNELNAPIFIEFSPVGRLQQLEGAAMRLDHLLHRKRDAARLAMRIFSEDEYILECAFTSAATALLELMRDEESDSWAAKTKFSARQDLRRMLKACKSRSVDLGKSVVIGLEINEQFEGDLLLEKLQSNCEKLYDTHCSTDDHFGLVAYTVNGEINVELGLKAENHGRQRAMLELATTTTSDRVCPALPYAVQMVVDSAASTENDSYIVLIADGYSWDPATYFTAKRHIERLNRERSTTIHLFILGLHVEEEEVIQELKAMCNVSRLSLYADITKANIDSTFDVIGGIISGNALYASCFQSLTMEKF